MSELIDVEILVKLLHVREKHGNIDPIYVEYMSRIQKEFDDQRTSIEFELDRSVDLDHQLIRFVELVHSLETQPVGAASSTPAPPSELVGNSIVLPRNAEYALHLLLPKSMRDSAIGDLEEEYRTIILPKFGPRYAWFWYWGQTIGSVSRVIGDVPWRWFIRLKSLWMSQG